MKNRYEERGRGEPKVEIPAYPEDDRELQKLG